MRNFLLSLSFYSFVISLERGFPDTNSKKFSRFFYASYGNEISLI